MKCENNFCIYQYKGRCVLNKVSINNLGMCSESIYPDIDEKILNQAKSKLLEDYQNSDKNFNI